MLKILLTVAAVVLIVWALMRMLDTRAYARRDEPKRPATPPRAVGPDDDPDFLRDLDRRRRRRRTARQDEGPEDGSGEPDST